MYHLQFVQAGCQACIDAPEAFTGDFNSSIGRSEKNGGGLSLLSLNFYEERK